MRVNSFFSYLFFENPSLVGSGISFRDIIFTIFDTEQQTAI